ncbi:hypothetical protein K461DRAFT_329088 [Myriangium duriaei CBS 260.36]|uniref:Sodium/calcium exchanger membrane region domain-containing protein n=1 Tax=Myriangium duriaei CBS 260.36 TaxID=1168546 RepID=A0A9P4IUG3_9PEZI|nr:hypothetical protein K461DRAFT_329088 [Myriangium duriaei CBS 260.36]
MATAMDPSLRLGRQGARRLRDRRFSTRALYLTCLVLTVLALLSFWPERRYGTLTPAGTGGIQARDLGSLEATDDTCRLVHEAKDKCAFIRKHCPDDEPGFLEYLQLYYCNLSHVKPVAFIILMFWLGLLFSTIGIAASDFFCINLSTIATILGMSESLAGVTFLAFGNGSPDVFSTFAAMSTNSSSLAIGELIGAAGFITAVVAGSMALVRPFKVARKSFVRDVGFFAVAAAFSMGFLSDGHLHLWECLGMVIYYVFYVAVVVIWHWWITRRARRRERDAAARGHFNVPGIEEAEVQEEYLDDPDDESRTRASSSRGASVEDFRALEGGIPRIQEPEDDEDDDENRELLGEITGNMRLKRPGRHRRNTITPVRPSLVGALEFQAVLKSLNRSRNIQTIPMHARRYSDDPSHILAQHETEAPATTLPAVDVSLIDASNQDHTAPQAGQPARPSNLTASGRARAVSANDAAGLQLDPRLFHNAVQAPKLVNIPEDGSGSTTPHPTSSQASRHSSGLLSPESATRASSRTQSPAPSVHDQRAPSPDFLQLPNDNFLARDRRRRLIDNEVSRDSPDHSPKSRPRLSALQGASNTRSSGRSSPISPFPLFHDNLVSPHSRLPSLYLPPPASASGESQSFPLEDDQILEEARPPSWWPSRILPSPLVLFSTLFPTLCHWRDKSWWEILLGLVAAPSVLLLTVTLPVVDTDRDEDDDESIASPGESSQRKFSGPQLQVSTPREDQPLLSGPTTPGTGAAGVAAKAEQHQQRHGPGSASEVAILSPNPTPLNPTPAKTQKTWNRWLTIIQLYLSPIMIVLILYTQYIDSPLPLIRTITRPILISLLVSTLLLIPLLLTTTPTHRPPLYAPILSLAGFVVSIAWISTIASQVVAVLKTFAIILNMSHAILGLTVFAVGNSLGDLVADITVARLGYPVMALSACFGGPMLNILLGIGLSGSYLLIRGAQKRLHKHPEKGWKSGTYEIQVGDTLIVSGVTLLVTLVGLLVAVPLNGWMMSRRIAWALIALWCTGTVINIVLEVSGVGSSKGM